MRTPDLRLGIDVGGSSTDAVVLDTAGRVIAKCKVPTSDDVTGGMLSALRRILRNGAVDARRITHVMAGTTHATNALLRRRGLWRVAVVRIGSPSAEAIDPLSGWPDDLRRAACAGSAVIRGGFELDGREIASLDTGALARFLRDLPGPVQGVAITSVFASVAPDHEIRARDIVWDVLGEQVHVSLSHEIASPGIIERENATVLNAALIGVAQDVATAVSGALASSGLDDPAIYLAQNDGSVMALDYALQFPVLTIGSGPANSIRGAGYLSGLADAIVADVGGTSTDIGVLVSGFPRESAIGVRIGGLDTNVRMPDLLTIPIGGGTVISSGAGGVRVGPESIASRLDGAALIFGGDEPCLADAAVAVGRARGGTTPPPAQLLPLLSSAIEIADKRIADAIDRIKSGQADEPLVVVGGGSVILAGELSGVTTVTRPQDYDVANAVGAAIASVSGQIDRIFQLVGRNRSSALEYAKELARDQAVRAGADPAGIEITDIEEIPLTYMLDPAVRIRVKAVGSLSPL
ncbi:MAG TPA: hydantoinase/oxoprolinase family protein [Streptosporangiaceae bacterium]|jgi:N-methylhydantoinase A/oxoprolinase/acetone carboxylase beta subunit